MNRFVQSYVLFVLLVTGMAMISCQSGEPKEVSSIDTVPKEKTYTGARLVQVDSIMINAIGNFQIYDYQPESGLFLGGDVKFFISFAGKSAPKSNELGFLVINREGEVVHQFNNTKGGPNGHGSAMQSAFFMGPNAMGVLGRIGFYKYNLEGELICRYKEISYREIFSVSRAKAGLSVDGNMLALQLPKSLTDGKAAYSDSVFQLVKPLKVYDLSKDQPHIPVYEFDYPDDPQRNLNLGAATVPFVTMNPSDSLLYTLYPMTTEIVAYDLQSGKVARKIPLNPNKFGGYEVLKELSQGQRSRDWLNDGARVAMSRYHDMIQLGEYTLLRYSPPVPENAVRLLMTTKGLQYDPNWPRVRRKHYQFQYQLLKGGKRVLPDFELPALRPGEQHLEFFTNTLTRGRIIGGNGLDEIYVFIRNNGEEERDYELIRVFKLELLE